MFTGLVEAVGELLERKPTSGGFRLRIATSLARELVPGDSLAVNGVCLTVILAEDQELHAEVGPETIRVTTLGMIAAGTAVNLERPLRADGRFGGHFVQGHVDAIGHVEEIRAEADFHWLTVSFPRQLASLIVQRGSIAVDGVSLTVAGLAEIGPAVIGPEGENRMFRFHSRSGSRRRLRLWLGVATAGILLTGRRRLRQSRSSTSPTYSVAPFPNTA